VPREAVEATEPVGGLLILKAFSSGSSAMTGVEAISNGVPVFRWAESRNAATTRGWMSAILGAMLLGISVLIARHGPVPHTDEMALSQLARLVVGTGPVYFIMQIATLLILVLAANTSYADFPRLASLLACDRYVPRLFGFRSDRLALAVGIVVLSTFSAAPIPLYAVGTFVSCRMSHVGMVRHR